MQQTRACLAVALALTAAAVCAQVESQEQRLSGNNGYDDLYRTSTPYSAFSHIDGPALRPKGSSPRKLRLAFDSASSHVVATWKRPQAIYDPHLARYELRMRKDAYAWGEWQPAGAIVAGRSSITIYNVDPGTTYEVEVRARNGRATSRPTSARVTIPGSAKPPAL